MNINTSSKHGGPGNTLQGKNEASSFTNMRITGKIANRFRVYRVLAKAIQIVSFCLLPAVTAQAQQPVQVATLLRPPYTLQLTDYYASTQEKLVVILTNRDLNKPVLSVRLRMNIESQNVQLHTRDFGALPIIQLEAGVPLRLSLGDLAPYFSPDNLDFAGITRAQYVQQAKLPEGFYQFCFEAVEVTTGQVASTKTCSMAWISLSDPPLLNIPRKGEAVALKEPQNIIFQWTPRHLNSPNSAYVTEYDFQLVELWDNSLAPEVAFQSMQPLYETTTRATTLLYGPSQPLLLPGKRYGWRIRARARGGIDDVDIFRNQGYSEIYWFSFQDVCPPPTGINGSAGQFGNLEFAWAPNSRHTGYLVSYRQKDVADAAWFDQHSSSTSALVYDVKPGVEYEYRIAGFCNSDQPVYSDVYTVSLPPRESDSFVNCRIVPDPQITNRQPLTVLQPGDVFTAGDFPIKITQVGGAGSFSGRGYVTVPFLGRAKVLVVFDNIQVNTDKQLIAGAVITTYDVSEGSVADVDEAEDIFRDYRGIVSRLNGMTIDTDADDLAGVINKVNEHAEKELPAEVADQVKQNTQELLDLKLEYDQAKATHDALPDGEPTKKELEKKMEELKDRFEEIKSSFEGIDKKSVRSKSYTVSFVKNDPLTKYGFDYYQYPNTEDRYDTIHEWGEDSRPIYYIPWKSVPTGMSDWVDVVSRKGDVLPDGLFFRSVTGEVESSKTDAATTRVKVYGYNNPGEKTQIIAYQKKDTANVEVGKINVVSYEQMYRKLVVVPVNDKRSTCTREELEKDLNNIYSQALVQWSVEIKPPLISNYDFDGDGRMKSIPWIGSIAPKTYTVEMTQVIKDFAARESFDPDAHYLFLVLPAEQDWSGVNPFRKNVGFIFMDKLMTGNKSEFVITMAHEIGHGAFRLNHTFDELKPLPKGSTLNLMDYSDGSRELAKYQWDQIHTPLSMLSLSDGNYENIEKGDLNDGNLTADDFKTRVFVTLQEYQQNLWSFETGKGDITGCFEPYKKQVTGLENAIFAILNDDDQLNAFALQIRDQVLNPSDLSQIKSAVCSAITEKVKDFKLLITYDSVQYEDGESIYVEGEESEIKLEVSGSDASIVLNSADIIWQGATGQGDDAVVKLGELDETELDEPEQAVTVAAASSTARVLVKRTYVTLAADKFFAPTVENLDVAYTVKSGDWKYAKFEVFKNGDATNPVYVDNTIASQGKAVRISWDGKMNTGANKGAYINIYDSPYKVKLSVSTDEKFTESYSAEKQVTVEIQSLALTPAGKLNLVKPYVKATEILQDIEAQVKIRNKKGQGVATALPITLSWTYDDPDDMANDPKRIIDYNGDAGDDNAGVGFGGKLGSWKPFAGYTAQTKTIESQAEVNTTGENKGKNKVTFSASVAAGDNYILKAVIRDKAFKVLKQAKTDIWTVRKKIVFENVYEMVGSQDMAKIMNKSNIDPAFSGNGCTDYSVVSSIVKLDETKRYVTELSPPDPATELPSGDELADYLFGPDPAVRSAAQKKINEKAQAWYKRNDLYVRTQLGIYRDKLGIKPKSIIGAHYLDPKSDGDFDTGKTNYYPDGIVINVSEGDEPPLMVDPDGEWSSTQGTEELATGNTWIYLNVKTDKRRQIVGRHEVGHASDHDSFGSGDHATQGLMHPTSDISLKNPEGVSEFSDESIVILRGRTR